VIVSEQILALTFSILRALPNYRKYRVGHYEVTIDWSEDRKTADVSYTHHGVTICVIKALAIEDKKQDRAKVSLETVHTFDGEEQMKELWPLLAVISTTNYQNDRESEDTLLSITRYW
jgi:hypothetical protein